MTDTERLDFIEREGFTLTCQWKNTGWAGGPKWSLYQYASSPLVQFEGDDVRELIDRASQKKSGACSFCGETKIHGPKCGYAGSPVAV